MNAEEDDIIRIKSCSRERETEKLSSHGSNCLVNSKGTVGSVPKRFQSSSDKLTSFGNIQFNEEVKCKGLRSIKASIEGNVIILHLWNDVLVTLCVMATILDPLFCYILVVDTQRNCIGFDKKLRVIVVVLRSLIDFGYMIMIIFHFQIGYIASYDAKNRRLCSIARRYFLSYFTVDILTLLPIPQVMVLLVIPASKGSHFTTAIMSMKFVFIIQYLPRVFRVQSFLKKVRWSSGIIPNTTGTKAMFNLFLYILASHVFGAFWYLFSVERRATCLQERCHHNHPYCPKNYKNSPVESFCMDACSAKPLSNNTTAFNFGIFDDAFKSGVVYTSDFIWKISYCYWWGLQNLSSLGQGLKTSKYIWEIYFASAVTMSGLVLFAFLVGNLQTFLQATVARAEELRLKGQDIEMWMAYHSLPRDLKKRIKRYEKYRWRKTRGIDVESILQNLPRDIRRDTTRHLCLGVIASVSMFQNMDEKFLDAVFGFLKPVLYIEHNFIVREGEPLDEMIFIIHGKLWIYSNSSKDDEASCSLTGTESLQKGDFFGEELLNWVLKDPFLSTVPKSTKTVTAHTKVEAFVLSANDLKIVVSKFWWLFSREFRNDPLFKERWAPWAALVLQAAWRRYFKNKREKEKSQSGLVTKSGNQPPVTTTIHVAKFVAGALHALNRRRKGREGNKVLESSKGNDLPESCNV